MGQFCDGWRRADTLWQWTVNATAASCTGFVSLIASSVTSCLTDDRDRL